MAANTDEALAFDSMNYKLLLVGIGIVILGFILMSVGGTGDPEVFDAKNSSLHPLFQKPH